MSDLTFSQFSQKESVEPRNPWRASASKDHAITERLSPWRSLIPCQRFATVHDFLSMPDANYLISRLQLEPLQPEGGYFKRTWTSLTRDGEGPAGTAIYFLLTSTTYSAFHRLKADEMWHFYSGDTVEHWQLHPGKGPIRRLLRGELRPDDEAEPQVHVPPNTWQAARLAPNLQGPTCGWALLGCTTNPGWRDGLFELAHRTRLAQEFPQNLSIINALTR